MTTWWLFMDPEGKLCVSPSQRPDGAINVGGQMRLIRVGDSREELEVIAQQHNAKLKVKQ